MVQSIPFAGENRDDDARSYPGTAVPRIWFAPQSLPSLRENSLCLSYLLWKIVDKTEKGRKTQEKRDKTFVSTENQWFLCQPPGSNCLLCSVVHTVILCCCRFFDGLVKSLRAAACCEVVVSSSLSTPTCG